MRVRKNTTITFDQNEITKYLLAGLRVEGVEGVDLAAPGEYQIEIYSAGTGKVTADLRIYEHEQPARKAPAMTTPESEPSLSGAYEDAGITLDAGGVIATTLEVDDLGVMDSPRTAMDKVWNALVEARTPLSRTQIRKITGEPNITTAQLDADSRFRKIEYQGKGFRPEWWLAGVEIPVAEGQTVDA